MIILSFDPGKHCGWAVLDTENKERLLQRLGTAEGPEELHEQLKDFEERYKGLEVHVVIEDYINRPPKAGGFDHTWDKGYTHRIIGRIEGWVAHSGISSSVYFQREHEKPGGYGIIGLKYVKGAKDKHHLDAVVHGYLHVKKLNLAPIKLVINALQGGGST